MKKKINLDNFKILEIVIRLLFAVVIVSIALTPGNAYAIKQFIKEGPYFF